MVRGAEGTYVGQSRNTTKRFSQHLVENGGRFTQEELNVAERFAVPGGRTARAKRNLLPIGAGGAASIFKRGATKGADHAVPIGPAPQNVSKVLDQVTDKGAPFPGYKGGSTFENNGKGMVLPRSNADGPIGYREWDVSPYVKGRNRGAERLVTGSDGSAYSTRDHYDALVRIR